LWLRQVETAYGRAAKDFVADQVCLVLRANFGVLLAFFLDSNLRPFLASLGVSGGKETRVKRGLSIFEVAGLASSALGGPAMTYL